jgi:hypothetical protein
MTFPRTALAVFALAGSCFAQTPAAKPEPAKAAKAEHEKADTWQKDPSAWEVDLYPIYGFLPNFSSSITLPELPNLPGSANRPKADVSSSFNGAWSSAFAARKNKWVMEGGFLWASVSADNNRPVAKVGLDTVYGAFFVGRELAPGLALEGGFRRMNLDLSATIEPHPGVSRNIGLWDPLIGMTYRKQIAKKWMFTGHADGGGFGVGSNWTIGARANLDWRFTKHLGASFGYSLLFLDVTQELNRATIDLTPKLYGPVLGLGIYF